MSLAKVRQAIVGKNTEQAERNAIGRLLLGEGWMGQPDVISTTAQDGRKVRVYRYTETPFGDFALITGPDVASEVVTMGTADAALAEATAVGQPMETDDRAARSAAVGAPARAQENPFGGRVIGHGRRELENPAKGPKLVKLIKTPTGLKFVEVTKFSLFGLSGSPKAGPYKGTLASLGFFFGKSDSEWKYNGPVTDAFIEQIKDTLHNAGVEVEVPAFAPPASSWHAGQDLHDISQLGDLPIGTIVRTNEDGKEYKKLLTGQWQCVDVEGLMAGTPFPGTDFASDFNGGGIAIVSVPGGASSAPSTPSTGSFYVGQKPTFEELKTAPIGLEVTYEPNGKVYVKVSDSSYPWETDNGGPFSTQQLSGAANTGDLSVSKVPAVHPGLSAKSTFHPKLGQVIPKDAFEELVAGSVLVDSDNSVLVKKPDGGLYAVDSPDDLDDVTIGGTNFLWQLVSPNVDIKAKFLGVVPTISGEKVAYLWQAHGSPTFHDDFTDVTPPTSETSAHYVNEEPGATITAFDLPYLTTGTVFVLVKDFQGEEFDPKDGPIYVKTDGKGLEKTEPGSAYWGEGFSASVTDGFNNKVRWEIVKKGLGYALSNGDNVAAVKDYLGTTEGATSDLPPPAEGTTYSPTISEANALMESFPIGTVVNVLNTPASAKVAFWKKVSEGKWNGGQWDGLSATFTPGHTHWTDAYFAEETFKVIYIPEAGKLPVGMPAIGDTWSFPSGGITAAKEAMSILPVGTVVKMITGHVSDYYRRKSEVNTWVGGNQYPPFVQSSSFAVWQDMDFEGETLKIMATGSSIPTPSASPASTSDVSGWGVLEAPPVTSKGYDLGNDPIWYDVGGAQELADRIVVAKVKPKKGSQPGGPVTDPVTRKHFYIKFIGAERARAEAAACQLYRRLGIPAPDARIAQKDGDWVFLSPWKKGLAPISPNSITGVEYDVLARSFPADAWLANWDVIGAGATSWDNLLRDPSESPTVLGRFFRVDNGGTFYWKATGGKKPFSGSSVPELQSMVDPSTNPTAAVAFKRIKVAPYLGDEVVQRIFQIVPSETLAWAGISGWQGLSNTLVDRAIVLHKWQQGLKAAGQTPTPAKVPVGQMTKGSPIGSVDQLDSMPIGTIVQGPLNKYTKTGPLIWKSDVGSLFQSDALIGEELSYFGKVDDSLGSYFGKVNDSFGGATPSASAPSAPGAYMSVADWAKANGVVQSYPKHDAPIVYFHKYASYDAQETGILSALPKGSKVTKGTGNTVYEKNAQGEFKSTSGTGSGVKTGQIKIYELPSGENSIYLVNATGAELLPVGSTVKNVNGHLLIKEKPGLYWKNTVKGKDVNLSQAYKDEVVSIGTGVVSTAAPTPSSSLETTVGEMGKLPVGTVILLGTTQLEYKKTTGAQWQWIKDGFLTGQSWDQSQFGAPSQKITIVQMGTGQAQSEKVEGHGVGATFTTPASYDAAGAVMAAFPVGTLVMTHGKGGNPDFFYKKVYDSANQSQDNWSAYASIADINAGNPDHMWNDTTFGGQETVTVVNLPGGAAKVSPGPLDKISSLDQFVALPIGAKVTYQSGNGQAVVFQKVGPGKWENETHGGFVEDVNFQPAIDEGLMALTGLPSSSVGPVTGIPSAGVSTAAPKPKPAPPLPPSIGVVDATAWVSAPSSEIGHPKGTWEWLVDPEGSRWLTLQAPKGGDAQVRAAYTAMRVYQLVGAASPDKVALLQHNGHLRVGFVIPQGFVPCPDDQALNPFRPALAEEFPADAWLANWPVIGPKSGMTFGIWKSDKSYLRVLTQGCFDWTYSGSSKKAFDGATIPELHTMLTGSYNTTTAYAFAEAAVVDADSGSVQLHSNTYDMLQKIAALELGQLQAIDADAGTSYAPLLLQRAKVLAKVLNRSIQGQMSASAQDMGVDIKAHPDSGPKSKTAAGALITDGKRVLLAKRAAWMKNEPNAWALPSGSAEKGESATQTAMRETIEELGGFPPEAVPTGFQFTAFYEKSGITFTTVVFYVPSKVADKWQPPLHKASHAGETAGWTWVPLDEIESLADEDGNVAESFWRPKLHEALAEPISYEDDQGNVTVAPLLAIWKEHAAEWAEAVKSAGPGLTSAFGIDWESFKKGIPFNVFKNPRHNPKVLRNPEGYILSGVKSEPGKGSFIEYRPRLLDGTRPRIRVPIDSRTVSFAQVGQEFREAIKAKRLGLDYPLDEPLSPETSLVGTGIVTKSGKPIWPAGAMSKFMLVCQMALGKEHPTAQDLSDAALLEAAGLPIEKATPELHALHEQVAAEIAAAVPATVEVSAVLETADVVKKIVAKAMPTQKVKLTKEQVNVVEETIKHLKNLLGPDLKQGSGDSAQKSLKTEIYNALHKTFGTTNINSENPGGRYVRVLAIARSVGLWPSILDPGARVVYRGMKLQQLGASFSPSPDTGVQVDAMLKAGISKASIFDGNNINVNKAGMVWLQCQTGAHPLGIGFRRKGSGWEACPAKELGVPTAKISGQPWDLNWLNVAYGKEEPYPTWADEAWANVDGLHTFFMSWKYELHGEKQTLSHWTVQWETAAGFAAGGGGNKQPVIMRSRTDLSMGFVLLPGKMPDHSGNGFVGEYEILHVDLNEMKPVKCQLVHSSLGGTAELSSHQRRAWVLARPPYPKGGVKLDSRGEVRLNPREIKNPYPHESSDSTVIQTLLFDQGFFSRDEARAWAAQNGYEHLAVDIPASGRFIHLRQRDPSSVSGMRTITLTRGVKAVIGHPK